MAVLRASQLHLSRFRGNGAKGKSGEWEREVKRKERHGSGVEGEAERAEWAGFKEEVELREKSIQGS